MQKASNQWLSNARPLHSWLRLLSEVRDHINIFMLCTHLPGDLNADVDLTQNPKDAAKDIGNKVQQATPDVGANPFDDILGKVI